MDWFSGTLNALDADAPSVLRYLSQNVGVGNDVKLYHESLAWAEMNTKGNGRVLQAVAAARVRSDEEGASSPHCSMVGSLVRDATIYCLFRAFNSLFRSAAGSARLRGRVVADSFCIDAAARFEHVIHTFSIVMASCATKSSTKKLLDLRREDFITAPQQHFAKLADRNAYQTGWIVQGIITVRNKCAFSVGISTIRELVRPFAVLSNPCSLFEALKGKKKKQFVRCNDEQLYNPEATINRISEVSFFVL